MNTLVLILIGLTIYAYWRFLSQQLASVNFKSKLNDLQEEVYDLVESGKVPRKEAENAIILINWAIEQYHFISLFTVTYGIIRVAKMKKAGHVPIRPLSNQRELQKINNKLVTIIVAYILAHHNLTYAIYKFLKPSLKSTGFKLFGFVDLRHAVDDFIIGFASKSRRIQKNYHAAA